MSESRRGQIRSKGLGRSGLEDMKCPAATGPFSSDDDLLAAAMSMFRVRSLLREANKDPRYDEPHRQTLHNQNVAWTHYWHRSFQKTLPSVVICGRCQRHRLNRTEREVLVLLLLRHLGMIEVSGPMTINDILKKLMLPDKQQLQVPKMLSTGGRLFRTGLTSFADHNDEIYEREPVVDPTLIDMLVSKRPGRKNTREVSTEAELYDRLEPLTRALATKSNEIGTEKSRAGAYKSTRRVDRLLQELNQTLQSHPQWKLKLLRNQVVGRERWTICLALLGKELGHMDAEERLFTGGGLGRAARQNQNDTATRRLLSARSDLLQRELIRPCSGTTEFASDDPAELERTEYELAEKALSILDINKKQVRRSAGEFAVREPQIRLDQLVLSDQVRQTLAMAVSHAQHEQQLMVEWGLKEVFSYGNSPVLLFSGPPGVGKTAAAEGLAHELGRPLLVADYSRIQNCFVGETEKRIMRAFREARRQEAVLFWDEADAMFYDRDSARYNWEVRSVNVLLQELERFEGVCILATNRKIALDKALERRVSLKVEFERPDRGQRQGIWRKMFPKKLPRSPDVDVERLSEVDLVGGEIKNVVLNAARLAAERGGKNVAMQDFQQAIAMEKDGQWSGHAHKLVGFAVE